ncbi:hypothetical protein BbCV1_s3gp1 [Beauveria bassiana chrysovirus 1]|uniref:RNA-directed RNA polymerase n=1 Tax=Beauveria bassiana chrysovirus 1 TaxID=2501274 RepID=A0A3T0D271_9VIRU|nr:hypothetical protein BbCV1_s3gp1 [Beauveria bassiana chrysovirus 1]
MSLEQYNHPPGGRRRGCVQGVDDSKIVGSPPGYEKVRGSALRCLDDDEITDIRRDKDRKNGHGASGRSNEDLIDDVADYVNNLSMPSSKGEKDRRDGISTKAKLSLAHLVAKLKAGRHRPGNVAGKEPRSRRDYHEAMERLRQPGKDFWSDEVKANKKVEAAAKAAVRRARVAMPACEVRVPSHDELRTDFVGIVLPMGHGKSTLAREEGWIEFDSLISPKKRSELIEQVFDKLIGGATFSEALQVLLPEARKTLALLRPQGRWVILAQDAALLAGLNIECAGGIIINPEVVHQANTGRGEHQRLLIDRNMEEVYSERFAAGALELASSFEEARMQCYGFCLMYGVSVSRPADFGLTDSFLSSGPGLTSGRADLETVIAAHDQGLVPRETVDHQVYLHKMGTYKGFGFTADRWARLMSKVTSTIGDDIFADSDWNPSIISLESFSAHTDLSEHEDVQYILSAQKGEHERFILGLILHWKGIGMHCGLGHKLLPFYGVRRCHWSSVMSSLGEGIVASGTFMGMPLAPDEREHLLSLCLLVGGSLKDMQLQMYNRQTSRPRVSPSKTMEHKIVRQLDTVVFERPTSTEEYTVLGKVLDDSKISSLDTLRWQIGSEPIPMPLNEAIALCVGLELCSAWAGDEDAIRSVPGIMHKLVTKWYRVSVLRDEWSDFIHRVLVAETSHRGLAHAIARICSCSPAEGRTGLDWGLRVCEALKGFIVCSIVAPPKALIGVVREGDIHRPCVAGMPEGELWAGIIRSNIPKHALGVFGGTVGALSLANELCKWRDNPTVAILEMINIRSWEPTLGPKRSATILYRWARVCKGKVSDAILKYLLDSHSRMLFSHSYARVSARLELYARLRAKDGGLGCNLHISAHGHVEKVDKNGGWCGSGAIVIDSTKTPKNKKSLEDRIRDFQDHEFQFESSKDPKLALNLCGPLVCSVLSSHGKSALNSNALLLHQLAGQPSA